MALKFKKLSGFGDELLAMHKAAPADDILRSTASLYLATKGALGVTTDMRSTAIYAQAQRVYKERTGAEWTGNP